MDQIDTYSVVYGEGTSTKYIALQKGGNIIAILIFLPDSAALPPAEISGSGYHQWYFHLNEYLNIIDLLRNEKPVYCTYGTPAQGALSGITTYNEPVGEGEKPVQIRVLHQ